MSPSENRLHDSLARFTSILQPDEIQAIHRIQEQPLPIGVRINLLKRDPEAAILDLAQRYNWDVQSIPFCNNGWVIHDPGTPPGLTLEHRLGQYYLQDAASMVPVSLFDFSGDHPVILDMAASPGGKTTHLIDRTMDKAFIIANDSSRNRISALRSVLINWGGISQIVTCYPGEKFGTWYPETFDYILLDAPCSMENLRPSPSHPLRETSADERLRLQSRQVALLVSGLSALKTGGQLVYATCSLAPEEDEAVVDTVLKQHPGKFKVDNIRHKMPFPAIGLKAFVGQTFHPDLEYTLRLWPHLTGMSGFFCARLTKIQPFSLPLESAPARDLRRTHLQPAEDPIQSQVFSQLNENYGFDLDANLSDQDLALYRRFDQVFLLPKAYLHHFKSLPFELIGMLIGRINEQLFEPSSEFISRFGHKFTRGMIQIEDTRLEQWISGRDIRHPVIDKKPAIEFVLVKDSAGRNLGLGKLLPNRLRNMRPK